MPEKEPLSAPAPEAADSMASCGFPDGPLSSLILKEGAKGATEVAAQGVAASASRLPLDARHESAGESPSTSPVIGVYASAG